MIKPKRMLVVAPSFFGYSKDITTKFMELGCDADLIPDVPSEGVAYKSVSKVSPALLKPLVSRYASRVSEMLRTGVYETVLFLGGMTFPFSHEQIEEMRSACPSAIFAFYLWDSLSNSKMAAECIDLFDTVISFEKDAHPSSIHLPLFYTAEYGDASMASLESAKYDACFVGSVHQPSKFAAVLAIVDALRGVGFSVYTRFYLPSKSSLLYLRARHPLYRRSDLRFAFDSLSRSQIASLYAKSICVIDSPQSGQTGLTMRTIEAVGAGRKLITSNAAIEQYDLYEYGDVLLYPCSDHELVPFMRNRQRGIPEDIRRRYSLDSWVKTLLCEIG